MFLVYSLVRKGNLRRIMDRKIAVVYSSSNVDVSRDEQDVLLQVEAISNALLALGYEPVVIPLTSPLEGIEEVRKRVRPPLVFNLVESLMGEGRFIHIVPALLEFYRIPFTGCSAQAHFLTSNKLVAKSLMSAIQIPTPPWVALEEPDAQCPIFDPPYIVKSVWEHASVGIEESSVFQTFKALAERARSKEALFCEQYIHGREINLSLLGGRAGPTVLPAAEILFLDHPPGKPWIVGYRAKWEEGSREYQNTPRSFRFARSDDALLRQLHQLALRCWKLFGLKGYARVDFRVDASGRAYVLEVNANPCLSPGAGFLAAAEKAKLSLNRVVERILEDAVE
jgi:D-alanine-D-alanine ligase